MNSNFIMEIVKPRVKCSTFLSYSDFYRIFSGMKFSKEEFDTAQSIIENEGIELTYLEVLDEQIDEDVEESLDTDIILDSDQASWVNKHNKDIKQMKHYVN